MNKKLIGGIIVVIVVIGGIYFVNKSSQKASPLVQDQISTTSTVSTEGWKTYTNKQFGFSILIPADLIQGPDYPTKDDNVIFTNAKTGVSLIFRSHDLDYPDNLGTKTINGVEWKVSGSSDIEGYTVRYTTNRNGSTYMFSIQKTDELLLNQILGSLGFTN